jgi:type II restriction/modification system DNA methylase subunit YeeA
MNKDCKLYTKLAQKIESALKLSLFTFLEKKSPLYSLRTVLLPAKALGLFDKDMYRTEQSSGLLILKLIKSDDVI